ncbi:MAG: ATP-binding cassette domain-containing protein [Clostridiales bacterium]|nr:ATP-binding cassette domain-containing protein [Clostridiales bacterium]
MLEIRDITKIFDKGTVNEQIAIKDISLTLQDGEFVTIVGSNGAGKSTLFNAICGGFLVDGGHIFLDGENITFQSAHERARKIGRVFQDPMRGTAPNMTIEENLALAYARSGTRTNPFARAINKKNVDFFRESLSRYHMGIEDRMKTKIGLLSGGQRQVVTLLMCTLSVPRLLLLDEHTAALDPATAEKVMEITKSIVEENKLTTMMITHNLNQSLTTGSRTIMMDSGEIILDISGEEREHMTMDQMINMYSMKRQKDFDNDRILLSSR